MLNRSKPSRQGQTRIYERKETDLTCYRKFKGLKETKEERVFEVNLVRLLLRLLLNAMHAGNYYF